VGRVEVGSPRNSRPWRIVYNLYGGLAIIREAIQYGLVFSALIAALFATKLLREPPQLELHAEVRRLIAMRAHEEIAEILQNYNRMVRKEEGTRTRELGGSALTWLDPRPGSVEAEQSLLGGLGDTVQAIIRPSPDHPGLWVVQRQADAFTPLPEDPIDWRGVEGCDGRTLIVIDQLYGPVACVSPLGSLVALDGSPGIPVYAQELIQETDLGANQLSEKLHRADQAFRLEARVTILNGGDSTENGIRLLAPPGWRVPDAWRAGSNNPRCNGSGQADNEITLGPLRSCVVTYVTEQNSRAFLPLTPPTFDAVPETPPLVGLVFWILIAALLLMVLYLIADGLVNWGMRTGQSGGLPTRAAFRDR
jgi:hypothetical protein